MTKQDHDPTNTLMPTDSFGVPYAGKGQILTEGAQQYINDGETPETSPRGWSEMMRLSQDDGTWSMVAVRGSSGSLYFGKEYQHLFTFQSNIAARYWDDSNLMRVDNEANKAHGYVYGREGGGFFEDDENIGGRETAVLMRCEDNTLVQVRKTNPEEVLGKNQLFKMSVVYPPGDPRRPRNIDIPPEMLQGVFVRPGDQLKLGADPRTGRTLTVQSPIARIMCFNREKTVPANHAKMNRPERIRNMAVEFRDRFEEARIRHLSGSAAVGLVRENDKS